MYSLPGPLSVLGILGQPPHQEVGLEGLRPKDVVSKSTNKFIRPKDLFLRTMLHDVVVVVPAGCEGPTELRTFRITNRRREGSGL